MIGRTLERASSCHRLKAERRPTINKRACSVRSIRACEEILRGQGLQLESSQLDSVLGQAPELALPEHQELIAANIISLLRYMSAVELKILLLRTPRVLAVDSMEGWFQFLAQYGFKSSQVTHLISQAPMALVQASLVTAGDTLITMKVAGLDEEAIKAVVVCYPQLLHTPKEEVLSFLRTFSRFGCNISC